LVANFGAHTSRKTWGDHVGKNGAGLELILYRSSQE
jgi:hypothetical protein